MVQGVALPKLLVALGSEAHGPNRLGLTVGAIEILGIGLIGKLPAIKKYFPGRDLDVVARKPDHSLDEVLAVLDRAAMELTWVISWKSKNKP